MGRWPRIRVMAAVLGASVAVVLLAGVVHAKRWKEWAPGPLASDSTYAMFLARPSDSLSAAQLSWLAVQRDWRAQRDSEIESSSSMSITETGHPHLTRRTDERFAALVSQPYEALADTDRAWLVAENTAHQVARASQGGASGVIGGALVGALVGFLAGAALLAYAISHSKWPL